MGKVIRNKKVGISSFDTEKADLALWLMNSGYELICVHPKDGTGRLIYHFVITNNIENAALDYYESKKTNAQEQCIAAIQIAYKAFEKEERNVRKSK